MSATSEPSGEERLLEELKKRHAFTDWCGLSRQADGVFVHNFSIGGRELPGWLPAHIERVVEPGRPVLTETLWGRLEGRESMMRLEVWECDSRFHAHEFLMVLVGQLVLPVRREEEIDVGDVLFAPSTTNVLFARGNLVVEIRNAGRHQHEVLELARAFDRRIATVPEGGLELAIVPGAEHEILGALLGEVEPRDGETGWRIFSNTGEVRRQRGRFSFRVFAPGPHVVRAVDL